MLNEERVIYIDEKRFEYIGEWRDRTKSENQGVWIYDYQTKSYSLTLSCLFTRNHKFEELETFIFSYDPRNGFQWVNNLKKFHNLTDENLEQLVQLIIESEPNTFTYPRVEEDRLSNLFSA